MLYSLFNDHVDLSKINISINYIVLCLVNNCLNIVVLKVMADGLLFRSRIHKEYNIYDDFQERSSSII